MLKGFWLNFMLTVAICLGGLYSVNAIADLVEIEEEVELVGECRQQWNWTANAWDCNDVFDENGKKKCKAPKSCGWHGTISCHCK